VGKTRDEGQVIDAQTHFDLASLTKPLLTAPLAMLSIGAGKLGLDDTLDRFFQKPASLATRQGSPSGIS